MRLLSFSSVMMMMMMMITLLAVPSHPFGLKAEITLGWGKPRCHRMQRVNPGGRGKPGRAEPSPATGRPVVMNVRKGFVRYGLPHRLVKTPPPGRPPASAILQRLPAAQPYLYAGGSVRRQAFQRKSSCSDLIRVFDEALQPVGLTRYAGEERRMPFAHCCYCWRRAFP